MGGCACVCGKSMRCDGMCGWVCVGRVGVVRVWMVHNDHRMVHNDHRMETHSADCTGYVLELVYHLSHP